MCSKKNNLKKVKNRYTVFGIFLLILQQNKKNNKMSYYNLRNDAFSDFILIVVYGYGFGALMLFLIVFPIKYIIGNVPFVAFVSEYFEIMSFIIFLVTLACSYIYEHYKYEYKRYKLTKDEKISLYRYKLKGMNRKQKKRFALIVRVSPGAIFMKLKRMNWYDARKEYEYNEPVLSFLSVEDKRIFDNTLRNTKYTEKNETHTLEDWEVILTEKRIENLKGKIRRYRHI